GTEGESYVSQTHRVLSASPRRSLRGSGQTYSHGQCTGQAQASRERIAGDDRSRERRTNLRVQGKKDQASAYEWAFVAPEADLFDTSGKKIGRHYAGPHWESSDGSKIAGTVKASTDAPQADAIPWLLLVTKSVGPQGSFSKITSIQRVNTVGGVAPKTGCSQSTVGTTARIPYTADYYLL